MRGSQALDLESCAEHLRVFGGFLKCRRYQLCAGQYLATCSLRDKSLGVQPDTVAQERTNPTSCPLTSIYMLWLAYPHIHMHTHTYRQHIHT